MTVMTVVLDASVIIRQVFAHRAEETALLTLAPGRYSGWLLPAANREYWRWRES